MQALFFNASKNTLYRFLTVLVILSAQLILIWPQQASAEETGNKRLKNPVGQVAQQEKQRSEEDKNLLNRDRVLSRGGASSLINEPPIIRNKPMVDNRGQVVGHYDSGLIAVEGFPVNTGGFKSRYSNYDN
jgi:hypothetical protein